MLNRFAAFLLLAFLSAGEVILTLMDSTGRVVTRSGPGAIVPAP